MRIIIADDHLILRAGLVMMLKSLGYEVCGDVATTQELECLLATTQVDLVILDYNMPSNTLEFATKIKTKDSHINIIMLTGVATILNLRLMIDSCVDAVVLKESDMDELVVAIEHLQQGKRYISKQVDQHLAKHNETLTKREMDVLALILEGMKRAQIAEQLNISIETFKTHRKSIMSKLDVHDSSELAKKAEQLGYRKRL